MQNHHATFVLTAGPIEDRRRVAAGELVPCNDFLAEYKIHFEGRPNYENPVVSFATPGGLINVELARTLTGFAGKAYAKHLEAGANFNRVRRSASRWGLTVWIKTKSQEKGAA